MLWPAGPKIAKALQWSILKYQQKHHFLRGELFRVGTGNKVETLQYILLKSFFYTVVKFGEAFENIDSLMGFSLCGNLLTVKSCDEKATFCIYIVHSTWWLN